MVISAHTQQNMNETTNQPETIDFGGRTYTKIADRKVVSETPLITEGPFYSAPPEHAFTPDLAFLQGKSERPSAMHRVMW